MAPILIYEKLAKLAEEATERAAAEGRFKLERRPAVVLEQPRDKAHGDWATNIALVLSPQVKQPSHEVAAAIVENMARPDYLQAVEIAGPGFINFRLSPVWLRQMLEEICERQDSYGYAEKPAEEKVLLEFVSANPVGPMHLGHGRWAAVGDSLARLLTAAGYPVTTEFYINDYGTQMQLFGESVAARYQQLLGHDVPFPEEGYRGHYVTEIAQEIVDRDGDRYLQLSGNELAAKMLDIAYQQVLSHLKRTLADMDVHFDNWFSERRLHESSYLKETLDMLAAAGYVYKQDGATWLRTGQFGDDKDRVLIRETGEPTYFAADVAYHRDKLERGFDRLINIWGADHHGYVGRIRAAVAALGADPSRLEIIIGQLVNLLSGGRPVRMSKRTGEMVTLEELLADVGKDAIRYFFLMRTTDSPVDFDIELAKSHTTENPVYYVQYAHARICSILRVAAEQGVVPVGKAANLSRLETEPELALMRLLGEGSFSFIRAAEARAPYRLTKYAQDLATTFHFFYHECRVLSDDKELSLARLTLVDCTRLVLANVLGLIGVTAPERM